MNESPAPFPASVIQRTLDKHRVLTLLEWFMADIALKNDVPAGVFEEWEALKPRLFCRDGHTLAHETGRCLYCDRAIPPLEVHDE